MNSLDPRCASIGVAALSLMLSIGAAAIGTAKDSSSASEPALQVLETAMPDEPPALYESTGSKMPYWERLAEIRAERTYSPDVPKGLLTGAHELDGFDATFHYAIDVPDSYDPSQKTDLHIYLHGGVGISSNRISNRKLNRLKRQNVGNGISVYPSAWSSAKWWYESQTKNILKLIATVKESYNVDDNRIFLHGLSDGAAGAYYFASHLPTAFAGFVAWVGSPHVLRPKHNVFGATFPGNLVNKPNFALNTEDDHLFPADSVERLFEALNASGGDVTFFAMPGDHFGMPWLSKLRPDFERFIAQHTRNPYPDSLLWQFNGETPFTRVHWLIVEGTQDAEEDAAVVVEKQGNAVYLSSSNVAAITLLISSDHFDLTQSIQVWRDRELVFDQRLAPDVEVLDKWFEVDRDPTMLFSNEIRVIGM